MYEMQSTPLLQFMWYQVLDIRGILLVYPLIIGSSLNLVPSLNHQAHHIPSLNLRLPIDHSLSHEPKSVTIRLITNLLFEPETRHWTETRFWT